MLPVRGLVVAVLAVGLSACAATRTEVVHAPVEVTPAVRAAVHAGTSKLFAYPETARFGRMHAAQDLTSGTVYVCGFVSHREVTGRWTQSQPFMGVMADGGFQLTAIAREPIDWTYMRSGCLKRGIVI